MSIMLTVVIHNDHLSDCDCSIIGISPRSNLKADKEFLVILNNGVVSDANVSTGYRWSRRGWKDHYLSEASVISLC